MFGFPGDKYNPIGENDCRRCGFTVGKKNLRICTGCNINNCNSCFNKQIDYNKCLACEPLKHCDKCDKDNCFGIDYCGGCNKAFCVDTAGNRFIDSDKCDECDKYEYDYQNEYEKEHGKQIKTITLEEINEIVGN